MPVISAIYRGTVSYTSSDGTAPPAISIGGTVDTSKSLVLYSATSGGGTQVRDYRYFWSHTLTSTTVAFRRNTSSFAAEIELHWTVIEFEDATVQRGTATLNSDPLDITVTSVDTSRTLIVTDSVTSSKASSEPFSAELTSSTNLRIDVKSTSSSELDWQLVEFPSGEADVQAFSIARVSNENSGTVAISSVDTSLSVIAKQGLNTGSNWRKDIEAWEFDSSTQISFDKTDVGSDVWGTFRGQVIEFDSLDKQAGSATLSDGSLTTDISLTAIDDQIGFDFEVAWCDNVYQSSSGAPASSSIHLGRSFNGSYDTLTLDRLNSTGDLEVRYQVIEMSAPSSGIELAAEVSSSSTPDADLTTSIDTASEVSGSATSDASLTTSIDLAGEFNVSASTDAALSVSVLLEAEVSGTASADADVTTEILLEGSISAVASADAALVEEEPEFPCVQSVTSTNSSTSETTVAVNMPATVVADDLLLAFISTSSTGTVTASGWTRFDHNDVGGVRGSVFYKVAAGDEGGTTVDFTTTSSATWAALVMRVSQWGGTVGTDFDFTGAQFSSSNSSAPNPPSVTAGWGSDKNLYITTMLGGKDDATVSSYPTNYDDNQTYVSSGAGAGSGAEAACSTRNLEASSDDPGTYTLSEAEACHSWTFVVKPGTSGGVCLAPAAELAGEGVGSAAIDAALSTSITLNAELNITTAADALIQAGVLLEAEVSASAVVDASLTTEVQLTGELSVPVSADAALTAPGSGTLVRLTQSPTLVLTSITVPIRDTFNTALVSYVVKTDNRNSQSCVLVSVEQVVDEDALIEEQCEPVEVMSYKMNLLEMVQDILNDMNSDEVNSISDTTESEQVAQILRTTFYELMSNKRWDHLETLTRLENVSDLDRPNYLKIPDNIEDITLLKYNKRKSTDTRDRYEDVHFLHPDEFLDRVNANNSSASNVSSITDDSGVIFYVRNNLAPTFWTTFDNVHVVFDSYDSGVDTTVQSSKVQAKGLKDPEWVHDDCFIPDIPGKVFPGFLAEAKSTAFEVIKQAFSNKSEQKAFRQRTYMSQNSGKVKTNVRTPDYSRKPKGSRRSGLFDKN